MNKNKRESLFVKKEKNRVIILNHKQEEIFNIKNISNWKNTDFTEVFNHTAFIPKAIALTIMIRIFLSDLFIHGMGGGRYDLITNEIIKKFFKMKKAPYFYIISTEIELPIINQDIKPTIKKYEKNINYLKSLQHQPIKFLDNAQKSEFIERKKKISSLLSGIKDKGKRHQLYQELKTIDQEALKILNKKINVIKNQPKKN